MSKKEDALATIGLALFILAGIAFMLYLAKLMLAALLAEVSLGVILALAFLVVGMYALATSDWMNS